MDYQDTLTQALNALDNQATFIEDPWQQDGLGHGRTRVIRNGSFFEQGGVNFSEIQKDQAPPSLLGQHPELNEQPFWGAGVSMVLHPINPHCPTAHLNYRYFEAGSVWWFGGGCDLTPYYPYFDDCQHWHRTLKNTMDSHIPKAYDAYKYWCDEYFFNHHRNETRGIGGTFYDKLNGLPGPFIKQDYARQSEQTNAEALSLAMPALSWEQLFAFHQDNATSFLDAYLPIANRRQNTPWNDAQRQFQLYRRGRYVEFNLLHDRGTAFGLQSKGRVESILMSMPPLARWEYQYQPPPNSPELALTQTYLHRGIDWSHPSTTIDNIAPSANQKDSITT